MAGAPGTVHAAVGQPATALRPFVRRYLGYRHADAQVAIRFLVDAFGFKEAAVHTNDQGVVEHAELRWPSGGGIMLGSARPDSVLAGLPAGVGSVYVVTDEPDALFDRATAAGATVVAGLTDTDYGSRDFTVRDPEGVYWSFGTYAGE